jgi:hypothetical protein
MAYTRMMKPRGVNDTGPYQLASTYNIPLIAGSALIGSSTWTKWGGRNNYWLTAVSPPCHLHVWVSSAATSYMLMMRKSGAATRTITYLSHSTGCYVGKWQHMEFIVPIRASEAFNFCINQGKGASASSLGNRLGDLIIWEEN